jgi:hypothetical protein
MTHLCQESDEYTKISTFYFAPTGRTLERPLKERALSFLQGQIFRKISLASNNSINGLLGIMGPHTRGGGSTQLSSKRS